METSAAPMAPMMAAALPPPGVGLPPARSSRNFSTELSVTIGYVARSSSTDHRFGDGVNLFRVEQQVALLEQPPPASAGQPQLERTEAERAEEYLAVLERAAVALAHAFDSRRRRGIGVGHQLQCRAVPPLHLIEQCNACGAGGEHDLRALDRGAALGVAGGLE